MKRDFWKVRSGDSITVEGAQERARVISAFINWKKSRPGSLQASSRRIAGDTYQITFTGISPTEANEARLRGSPPPPPSQPPDDDI